MSRQSGRQDAGKRWMRLETLGTEQETRIRRSNDRFWLSIFYIFNPLSYLGINNKNKYSNLFSAHAVMYKRNIAVIKEYKRIIDRYSKHFRYLCNKIGCARETRSKLRFRSLALSL